MIYPTISSNGVGIIRPYLEKDIDTAEEMLQNGCTAGKANNWYSPEYMYGDFLLASVGKPLYFVYLDETDYTCIYVFAMADYYQYLTENGPFYRRTAPTETGYRRHANADSAMIYEKIPGIATVSSEAEGQALIEQLKTVDIPVQLYHSEGGIVRHLPDYRYADLIGSHLPEKEVA